jgi:hypothetical protein
MRAEISDHMFRSVSRTLSSAVIAAMLVLITGVLTGDTGSAASDRASFYKTRSATFWVRPIDDNTVQFCLDTYSAMGNVCEVAGTAVRSPNQQALLYRAGPQSSQCTLRLQPDGRAWLVSDNGGACARRSCGAGAGIGTIRFERRTVSRGQSKCLGGFPDS